MGYGQEWFGFIQSTSDLKNVFKGEVRGLIDWADVGRIRELVKSMKIPGFGPEELVCWCQSTKLEAG